MSSIHYFPRYSQQENVVTNNTLLLLLRLNQYNRFKFEKFMERICAEQEIQLASPWLQFRQQKKTGKSVVDGFIAQDSIKIAVETKLTEDFDLAQLKNHLALFKAEQNKLLILLSPSIGEIAAQQLALFRDEAMLQNIQVVHTSFEDVVRHCRECLSPYDEEMLALVDDYESFCSGEGLLPRDQYTIYTVPCRLSLVGNMQYHLYYCPVERTVRKAKYLGVYANRSIRAIGQTPKIIACNVNLDEGSVAVVDEITRLTREEQERILGACAEARTRDWDVATGYKFFLCDPLEETDFRKSTPGVIMGPQYVDLKDDVVPPIAGPLPADIHELARLLRHHKWT